MTEPLIIKKYFRHRDHVDLVVFKHDPLKNEYVPIIEKTYQIEVDDRFVFSDVEPMPNNEFEIICHEKSEIKEVDGKYYYVLTETGENLDQDDIIKLMIRKIVEEINEYDIENFLDYQFEKYYNREYLGDDGQKINTITFLRMLEIQFPDNNKFNLATYYSNHQSFILYAHQAECKRWVKEKIIKAEKISTTDQLTFKWLEKLELREFYSRLIKQGIIHPLTDYGDFKKVFSGNPLSEINTQIDWIEEKVLLAYLVDTLYMMNYINRDANIWYIAEKCFTKSSHLRQAKYNYSNNKFSEGKPRKHHKINSILS